MSEPDPPTRPVSPSQEGGTKAKMKVSMSEYRSRRLQQEATREREEHDRESERLLKEEQRCQRESIEAQKLELARLHEIEIQQAEIEYEIKYKQEQLRLEQEHMQKEQEANAKLLASQAWHTPVVFGSHTPCYDEHGQKLDYHDDVPATSDSQEAKSWGEYFCQQEHNANPCGLQDVSGGVASLEEEARILQGPTMKSMASEEAMLLRDEETPTMDMRQFLAGLETLTSAMLSKLSTRIEHLRQLATPWRPPNRRKGIASSTSTRPTHHTNCSQSNGAGPAESDQQLGTSPACQRMPTHPPGEDETKCAAAILVKQMTVKVPGMPFHKPDQL